MTLRDDQGRENIVSRFVNDLFAWLAHIFCRLIEAIIIGLVLILIFVGLVRCFSEETEARVSEPTALLQGGSPCSHCPEI